MDETNYLEESSKNPVKVKSFSNFDLIWTRSCQKWRKWCLLYYEFLYPGGLSSGRRLGGGLFLLDPLSSRGLLRGGHHRVQLLVHRQGPRRPLVGPLHAAPHGPGGTLDILPDLVADQAGDGVDALAGAGAHVGRLGDLAEQT